MTRANIEVGATVEVTTEVLRGQCGTVRRVITRRGRRTLVAVKIPGLEELVVLLANEVKFGKNPQLSNDNGL